MFVEPLNVLNGKYAYENLKYELQTQVFFYTRTSFVLLHNMKLIYEGGGGGELFT
jgi:hypothetical protein